MRLMLQKVGRFPMSEPAPPDDLTEQHRALLKSTLKQMCEQTLDDRIDRYLSIGHQQMIGVHHFAQASTECIEIYRDGYFLSALMVSHAVAEGILKFVIERNGIQRGDDDIPAAVADLLARSIISQDCADAFLRIYRSFRNDVHHMNPGVAKVPFPQLAERNIKDLATLEREIFGVTTPDGRLKPNQPKYWDTRPDGMIPVYFRL